MASDFGDESGEKLFDWMLCMGQDASETIIRENAEKLKSAIHNLRGKVADPPAEDANQAREYARLNLSEFEELPDYASLREIISERLDAAAIEHDIVELEGHDHLIFKVSDAPEVDEVFKGLEQDVDVAADKACEAHEQARLEELSEARDSEPLEAKAKAAKEASKAARDAKADARQVERFEVKSR